MDRQTNKDIETDTERERKRNNVQISDLSRTQGSLMVPECQLYKRKSSQTDLAEQMKPFFSPKSRRSICEGVGNSEYWIYVNFSETEIQFSTNTAVKSWEKDQQYAAGPQ